MMLMMTIDDDDDDDNDDDNSVAGTVRTMNDSLEAERTYY